MAEKKKFTVVMTATVKRTYEVEAFSVTDAIEAAGNNDPTYQEDQSDEVVSVNPTDSN